MWISKVRRLKLEGRSFQNIIFFLFLIYSSLSYTQEINSQNILFFPENKTVYFGYNSVINIIDKEDSTRIFDIECMDCYEIIVLDSINSWAIIPKKQTDIELNIYDSKKNKLLKTEILQVDILPKPDIFINNADEETHLTQAPDYIIFGHPKKYNILSNFSVISWEILINGKSTYRGYGKWFSERAINSLNNYQKGEFVLTIIYRSPDGPNTRRSFNFTFDLSDK